MKRLRLIAAPALLIAATVSAAPVAGPAPRYGLIGRMTAQPGQRDALAALLAAGSEAMPGCLSYVVAADPTDANALWVTEAWTSRAAHDASLALPAVRRAIAQGRPLIAAMGDYHETRPLGGTGIAREAAR